MNIAELGKSNFIALETFRLNGKGVVTPVWVAEENHKLYVWTNLNSWKVKRIRNNWRIRISESDARGNPKTEWIDARASLLDSDESLTKVKTLFKSKYGIQFQMFSLMSRTQPKVVIEIIQD